ncbi:acylase [Massilia antarctica]|uniref:acylase n=1 Tax=Massilia antarctica TaxID=2765360 RepID=UPI0006BB7C81|nr:acylase [Massilia sp. H27-R4]MCY0915989.1 acylase [Massilia sp. H27-R4]CUI05610.1 Acyl-homoserine lactone acylase PvdQ, quorum-quenching [Janthinobacterium sp. CG23_2]CUU29396.1 Acyl-homoserine lactone acylase PvdQ, quorum-quenching [Janthinobacterium sp. CG23_2]
MTPRLPVSPTPLLRASGAALLLALSACSNDHHSSDPAAPKYAAEIRRTAYGIAHIKADDDGGLGYGIGYAYAQDNICLMAERILTANGERAKYFGAEARGVAEYSAPNLASDYFFRLINEADAVATAWQQTPAPMRALVEGYVAGYNQYLDERGKAGLPEACKNAPWVRAMSTADMMKIIRLYAAEGAGSHFIDSLLAAVPPGMAAAAAPVSRRAGPSVVDPQYWKQQHGRIGSNGLALGKDATENGQGMLLANPHNAWKGDLRFYQLHLTIPGKLDVMGASLGGMPMVSIGFNKDVAWTHTNNTSSHFTLHQLQLDPRDPTRYLVDGETRSMTRKRIDVEVRQADGSLVTRSHDFYQTPLGVVMQMPGTLEWNRKVAYTMLDANMGNHRMLEQWRAMNSARSLGELREGIDRIVGLPWVNTVAVDKDGKTLLMDVTVVPNVPLAKEKACVPEEFKSLAAGGVLVLDASTSACNPANDPAAPQSGIFAGASLPRLERDDYVQNSNDSAWLTNPAAPLTGFPSIVSLDTQEQSGRTRVGISQLQARLAGTDGLAGRRMSIPQLQGLLFSNRVYFATQNMDDVLRACAGAPQAMAASGTTVDLAQPCASLRAWDRSANLDANIGFGYFANLWDQIAYTDLAWAVPFNPADPVNTPRGLRVDDAAGMNALRTALANAVLTTQANGWASDATWGQVQQSERGGKRIPIHGGDERYGIYNAITSLPQADGRREVVEGSSYIQTVMFDRNGPQAQAVLAYGQSVDPASPHYADQTALYSRKTWPTLPFTETQIAADPAYKRIAISRKAEAGQ